MDALRDLEPPGGVRRSAPSTSVRLDEIHQKRRAARKIAHNKRAGKFVVTGDNL
jgi:hypothetical protein